MPSRKLFIQAIVAFCFLSLSAIAGQAEQTVQFAWAVLTDSATGLHPLDFSTTPKLKTGTTLQIYLEQKPGAFIYLYLVDSTGGLTFLFPGDIEHYNSVTPTDRTFRIPPDSARFELMPPNGQEKLYLLAAPSRLTRLEELTSSFLQNPDDVNRRAEVIKELKLLRRQNSSLAQKTETSVPVAGTVRSRGGSTGSFDATQVNADGFYCRILRIDHE